MKIKQFKGCNRKLTLWMTLNQHSVLMKLFDAFQKQLEKQNTKSSSEKFNHEEDGGSGFPIGPSRGSLEYGSFNGRLKQPGVLADKSDDPPIGQDSSQHHKHRGAQLSKFSNSLAWHGSSRLDHSKGTSAHWPEDRPNGKYHQLNDAESSHHMLDGPNGSYKKHEHAPSKVFKTTLSILKCSHKAISIMVKLELRSSSLPLTLTVL